eukprot:gene25780-31130_t
MNGAHNDDSIVLKDLVLIGGGHAHVHVLKMLGMNPIPNLRVTLITRDIDTPYSGMLPGYLTGQYSYADCHIDLFKLCIFSKTRFIHAEVCGISTVKKHIYFRDGRSSMSYDVLSIDIGIVPKPLPCFDPTGSSYDADHAALLDQLLIAVKPIDLFAKKWSRVLREIVDITSPETCSNIPCDSTLLSTHAAARADTTYTVGVVGAGAGGVELSFAINFRLRAICRERGVREGRVRVVIFNKGASVLPSHAKATQRIVTRLLGEHNIDVVHNADIVDIQAVPHPALPAAHQALLLDSAGGRHVVDKVFWCTHARAADWLRSSGLSVDADNFILVKDTLESVNVPRVFAAGDVCHNTAHPRPKAGVFAVRAGPPLLHNLRAAILGESLEPWTPQTEFLGILSIGQGYAVSSKGGVGLEGRHLYELKEKIDRDWMAMYTNLPAMDAMMDQNSTRIAQRGLRDESEDMQKLMYEAKMRCGGCGSKVGSSILSRAMRRLRPHMSKAQARPDIIQGVGDDCAVTLCPSSSANSVKLVQTVDFFRSFLSDSFVMGQVCAVHALSDVYAMNAAANSALAMVTLPYGPERKMEEELVHLLGGMLHTMTKEGCALVGGHTAEAGEGERAASLGLAVSAFVVEGSDDTSSSSILFKSIYHHIGRVEVDNIPSSPIPNPSYSATNYVLVLTKPLGVGVLVAGMMRGAVSGKVYAQCIQHMLVTNKAGGRVLADAGALACTDVTGFGLLGHLVEMLKKAVQDEGEEEYDSEEADDGEICALPSSPPGNTEERWGACLHLRQIPVLEGAVDCVKGGVYPSLFSQNLRSARAIVNPEDGKGADAYPLLFDPQTSGGLLAFVPRASAGLLIDRLKDEGYAQAAVVGELVQLQAGATWSSDDGNLPPILLVDR